MGEDVKLQLLQFLLPANGYVKSRIVVQKEVRIGPAASLIPDVVLKLTGRVNTPVGVGAPFAQEFDPERPLAIKKERQHDLLTVRVTPCFQGGIRSHFSTPEKNVMYFSLTKGVDFDTEMTFTHHVFLLRWRIEERHPSFITICSRKLFQPPTSSTRCILAWHALTRWSFMAGVKRRGIQRAQSRTSSWSSLSTRKTGAGAVGSICHLSTR